MMKRRTKRKRSKRQKRAAAKLCRHKSLWLAAAAVMRHVAPHFPYTAVAFTFGFRGSPHIDTYDISHQWALSLGTWKNGGELCLEIAPDLVRVITTRERPARVDGRHVHWVAPYEEGGERYSIIWYVTKGTTTPILSHLSSGSDPEDEGGDVSL